MNPITEINNKEIEKNMKDSLLNPWTIMAFGISIVINVHLNAPLRDFMAPYQITFGISIYLWSIYYNAVSFRLLTTENGWCSSIVP